MALLYNNDGKAMPSFINGRGGESDTMASMDVSSVSQQSSFLPSSAESILVNYGKDASHNRGRDQFQQRTLFGRGDEIQQLRAAFERITVGKSELVVIRGLSGTGKSALVETLRSPVVHKHNCFFVSGKFDQMHTSNPFSALTACFTDLCDLILQSGELEPYRLSLQKALGSEVSVLESLIPNLFQVMGTPSNEPAQAFFTMENRGQAFTRFRHLCRSFINALATPGHPLVLFLDDMQWSDAGSIDILNHALIQNVDLKNVLIVVAYRDDGESLVRLGEKFLPCLVEPLCDRLPVTEIQLYNLTHKSVNDMLAALTGLPNAGVLPLGELVMSKTDGNCYFVKQFLEVLLVKKLIFKESGSSTFSWDIDKIRAETNISTNVVALVTARIQSLPIALQQVLTMAAFLGFAFDERVLTRLVAFERSDSTSTEPPVDVVYILKQAVEQGLLEETAVRVHEFKFSHDRVQQVLYLMVEDVEAQQKMHLRVGRLVKRIWDAESENGIPLDTWKLFIACDQLNDGAPQLIDFQEKMELVRLNLQTAKVAIQKTALIPAADYMRKAISIIENDYEIWSTDYELCLDLYATAAEIEYSLGNFDESTRLAESVREQATSSKDALRVNFTTLNSFGNQGEFHLALDLAVDLLDELGVKLPRHPSAGKTLREFARTKLRLHGWSYNDLAALPPMKNEEAKAALAIISQASVYGWYLWDLHMLGMCTFKMIELTLRYGITESTSFAFAGYGSFLMKMGRRKSAYQFGKLALVLCGTTSSPQFVARTLVLVTGYLNHYKVPVQDTEKKIMQAYRCGNSSGETAFGSLAACSYLNSSLYTGRHLRQLMDDGKVLCEQMEELGQDATYLMTIPLYQAVLHLIGFSEEPLLLSYEDLNRQDVYVRARESDNNSAQEMVHFVGFMLAMFFNKPKMARDLMEQATKLLKPGMCHYNGYTHMFLTGWCYFATSNGERKSLSMGRRCLKKLERRVKEGTLHLEPFVYFLRAERAFARGRDTGIIQKAYDDAITSAAKHDLPNYEALANERAGRALNNDSVYLRRAFDLYIERWGALAKANQMKDLLKRIDPDESQNSDTVSLL